ncbi:MAG TPA: ATP-binding protein, partial [Parafilimonas sp.]
LDYFDGKRFLHYRHNAADTNSIADDRIWEIFEDSQNKLWIGLFSSGLDLFDREHNHFKHYSPSNNTLHSGYISSLLEDKKGNLWIGTAVGITVLQNHTNKFYYYNHSETNTNTLSNDNIICLLEDANGKIWIGTRAGLNVFNPETNSFQRFNVDDGLPDNTILNILQDNENVLWISTPNGISKIIVSDKNGNTQINCTNYNESDGLQGREFNENAALKTSNGELIFGGANGFNIFNPSLIKTDYTIPNVVLTGFQVFNKDVSVDEKQDNNITLSKSITATGALSLKHKENVFSIEFSALNFINNKKSRYLYMLQGFDKNWLPANSNTRKVTYTNLDAGKYIFKVKASNEDGIWNNTPATLTITILPPFWQTTFAYILYVVAIIAILFFARRFIIQKAHARFALAQERKEAQRLHELDMLKILFFTNISHEFKTPLSLILTPLDKLVKNTKEEDKKNQLQLIQRNAKRLLNLVNQLFDFRKMEAQELKLHAEPGDIIQFIKDVSFSFTDMADRKNIGFEYHSSVAELYTVFDHDKIERILFNLLSNAFKFTPQNGKVSINIYAEEKNDESLLGISIKDNGIGIPPENQQKIFERFFQEDMPDNIINQGSGIGLSITKEFVKLHKGNISVESEPDKGSNFIVQIPFKKIIATEQPVVSNENISINKNLSLAGNKINTGKKSVLLLVEDNDDFRFYLKDNLKQYYT